jgi:hypothetical protein
MDWMIVVLLRRFPLWGINLGGVHRRGPVEGYVVEWCSSTALTMFLYVCV